VPLWQAQLARLFGLFELEYPNDQIKLRSLIMQ
jgi:hypothetical protein